LSNLGLVLRQIRTDLSLVVVLVLILGAGAFLGTAAPVWVGDRMDTALNEAVAAEVSQAGLTQRGRFGVPPESPTFDRFVSELAELNAELVRVRNQAPELLAAFGDGRWTLNLSAGHVLSIDGVTPEPSLLLRAGLWLPRDMQTHLDVVDGELPGEQVALDDPGPDGAPSSPHFEVAATADIADALQLNVGDELVVARADPQAGGGGELSMRLTGIVVPSDGSTMVWDEAPQTQRPYISPPGNPPTIHEGTLIADPRVAEKLVAWAAANQRPLASFTTQWRLDVDPDQLSAGEVEILVESIRRLRTSSLWGTSLDSLLGDYQASRTSAEQAAGLGVGSLSGLIITVQLLALWLLADRRAAALNLARVRGARDRVLARGLAIEAFIIGSAGIGVGTLAAALTLGAAWPVAVVLLLVTVVGLPLIGTRLAHQVASDRPESIALRPSARRLAAEAGLLVVAGAALWLLANRPADSGGGVDPVVSFTPLLVAAAVGVLVFRLLPYPVALVARALGPLRGATSFLSVTRAVRTPSYVVLPVVAVLIAVGVAAFGGSIRTTADFAQESTAWREVTAEVAVTTDTLRTSPNDLGAVVPEASSIAVGYVMRSVVATNERDEQFRVDVLVVDVPSWQQVVADAPVPIEPIATLAAGTGDEAAPAVVKGRIDSARRGEDITLGIRGLEVTATLLGSVDSFAGAPPQTTVVLPLDSLGEPPSELGLIWPNVIYMGGPVSGLNLAERLDGEAVYRADVVAAIDDDAMLTSTLTVFQAAAVTAALLAAAAAVLGLQVAARSRMYALSVLRTLGLPARSIATLIVAEVVPASIVAAVVGAVVGLGVAVVVSEAIDLSAQTDLLDAGVAVVPDVSGTTLAAAAVVAVVLLAVVVAVAVNRRARLGAVLRAGEQL